MCEYAEDIIFLSDLRKCILFKQIYKKVVNENACLQYNRKTLYHLKSLFPRT